MNNQHAARFAYVLLSAIALGFPGCSSDDDHDAPAAGGSTTGSGGTAAGRGGNTARAGSGQAGAGGNRCSNVTPSSGQSCQSVDAGRFCPGASGENCICTAQSQQQRGRQQGGERVWMCYGGVSSQPQGGTGGSPDMPVAGTPSEAGAQSDGGTAGSGGVDAMGGQPAAGAAGSGGDSTAGGVGGAGGAAAGEGGST